MTRIDFPDHGMGEHVNWMISRSDMAVGMGAFSSAVYGKSQLAIREREAARYTIALINDCAVCKDTRVAAHAPAAATGEPNEAATDEPFYAALTDWRSATDLAPRERLAAEYAERFCVDHLAMDDAFWARLRAEYRDEEITDLTICCAMWLGSGRAMAVIGVRAPDERLYV